MRFVTHFWEITPYILRHAIVGWVQSLGLCNECSGLRPSDTLLLIELVAWPATSCARGWAILYQIIRFIISKLRYCCANYIFVLDTRNTAWLRDTVRQTSLGKSAAGVDLRSALRPLTSLGTSAWPYRVTTQYSYYIYIYYIYIYDYEKCLNKDGYQIGSLLPLLIFSSQIYANWFLGRQPPQCLHCHKVTKNIGATINTFRGIGSEIWHLSWQQSCAGAF